MQLPFLDKKRAVTTIISRTVDGQGEQKPPQFEAEAQMLLDAIRREDVAGVAAVLAKLQKIDEKLDKAETSADE